MNNMHHTVYVIILGATERSTMSVYKGIEMNFSSLFVGALARSDFPPQRHVLLGLRVCRNLPSAVCKKPD
jgi:hypothetical protein